jgi:ribosomal protein S12 methylthiotransferase accessory factor
VKAVGESIERYCAALYDPAELVLASFDELEDATPPEDYAGFSERQLADPGLGRDAFRRDTQVRWVRGWSLVDDCARWVPAAAVYVPYEYAPGEARIWDMISTGLAAGPTRAAALARGILEGIERDALMVVWHNRLPRPALDLATVDDPALRPLLAALDGLPLAVEAFVLTLDLPATVFLLVARSLTPAPPHLVLGLGTDLDPRRALASSLEELLLGIWGMRVLAAREPDYVPAPDFSDFQDLDAHGRAYAVVPSLRENAAFLRAGGDTLTLDELEDRSTSTPLGNLERLVADVSARGYDVVGVDLTTDDVDDAGFAVCRAVVPGLQPLDIKHTRRNLGGRRVYEVPVALGLAERPLREDELNPDPHPFP